MTTNKAIKELTEKAVDLFDLTRGKAYDNTTAKMFAYIEVLAMLRNTSEDNEYKRISRLYKMRVKKGIY